MDFLAENIIDRSYAKMKNEFPTTRHNLLEERPLDDFNLRYAAVDAYVSFQLGICTSFFRCNLVVPQKNIACQGCKRDAFEIAKEEEAAARSRTYTWGAASRDAERAARQSTLDATGTSSPPSNWDLHAAAQDWVKNNTTSTWKNDRSWGTSKHLNWNDEQ